jgi:ketosteroid isomerase-like protein
VHDPAGDRVADTELEQAVERFYRDLVLDHADWAPETVAETDAALVIGTDPAEWWEGHAEICAAWAESRMKHGGTELRPTRLSIRRYGDIGLVTDEPAFSVEAAGAQGRFRLTLVFLQMANGGWRLLHLHASAPVDNEALLAS